MDLSLRSTPTATARCFHLVLTTKRNSMLILLKNCLQNQGPTLGFVYHSARASKINWNIKQYGIYTAFGSICRCEHLNYEAKLGSWGRESYWNRTVLQRRVSRAKRENTSCCCHLPNSPSAITASQAMYNQDPSTRNLKQLQRALLCKSCYLHHLILNHCLG